MTHRNNWEILHILQTNHFWGYLGAVLMFVGYLLYIYTLAIGKIDPNLTTWGLWALGGIIEFQAFSGTLQQHRKDERFHLFHPETLSNLICAFFAVIIFVSTLSLTLLGFIEGSFQMVSFLDFIIIPIDILVVWALYRDKNATRANMLMQLDIFFTFVPILHSTWIEPSNEWWVTWSIWVCSYLATAVSIFLGSKSGGIKSRFFMLVHPLHSALLHGAVGFFAFFK